MIQQVNNSLNLFANRHGLVGYYSRYIPVKTISSQFKCNPNVGNEIRLGAKSNFYDLPNFSGHVDNLGNPILIHDLDKDKFCLLDSVK